MEVEQQVDIEDPLVDYMLSRDHVRRSIRLPSRYAQADLIAFALSVADILELEEPKSYTEAKVSKEQPFWKKAMEEEIESLMKN